MIFVVRETKSRIRALQYLLGKVSWDKGGLVLFLFKIHLSFELCVYIGHEHMNSGAYGDQKRASGPLELTVVVRCYIGAGNYTWVSCNSNDHH